MAHKNLAGILQERGENAQAAELAEQAVATVEAFPDAWLTLGNSYVGLGRYQEAVTAYRRALELRADHAAAYTNLAAAMFFLGDAQGAVEASEQGLALDADQPAGWYNRIHFLAGAGRPLDAQQALQVAIARYPDYQARPEAEAKVRQAMQGIVANP
jgi:tetratricopeptide (TPR) repeat protein